MKKVTLELTIDGHTYHHTIDRDLCSGYDFVTQIKRLPRQVKEKLQEVQDRKDIKSARETFPKTEMLKPWMSQMEAELESSDSVVDRVQTVVSHFWTNRPKL